MQWRSLRGRFRDCPDPPFLLDRADGASVAGLSALGFESLEVRVAACKSERDVARVIGGLLGFPATFRGGWDGFIDLLHDYIVEPGRIVAVHILDADQLSRQDMRIFVRLVWMLMNASESVEADGAGGAQLEFLFWGEWRSWSTLFQR